MILDRAFAASGDENQLGDAGSHRLLDRILDQGLVHDRQHFLRAGLGCRQETRTHAATGKTALVILS